MMKLPALSEEECAVIASGFPDDTVRALAERISQHLQAVLGVRMWIAGSHATYPVEPFDGKEPAINIDAVLASAWLDLRYGGRLTGHIGKRHDPQWLAPLMRIVQRALAEAVINQGEHVSWPQAMQIQLQTGSLTGTVNIAWNSGHARRWAWQYLRAGAGRAVERSART